MEQLTATVNGQKYRLVEMEKCGYPCDQCDLFDTDFCTYDGRCIDIEVIQGKSMVWKKMEKQK